MASNNSINESWLSGPHRKTKGLLERRSVHATGSRRRREILEEPCATREIDASVSGRERISIKKINPSTYSSYMVNFTLVAFSQVVVDRVAFVVSGGNSGM
jgi:hypothetical protein